MENRELDAQLACDIAIAIAWFTRRSQQFAGAPVASPHWRALEILKGRGQMRIGDLAKLEGYTAANATMLIKQLLRDGLIEKVADPEDARSKLLQITAEGDRQRKEWEERLGGGILPVLQELSPEEFQKLHDVFPVLQKLKERFEEDHI